jgi:hypothetical protein
LQKCFRTFANAGVLEIVTCCKQILLLLDKTESKLKKAKEIFNFLCDQYPDLDPLHGKVLESEQHRRQYGHETLCIDHGPTANSSTPDSGKRLRPRDSDNSLKDKVKLI